jgi:hypothetical protein
LTDGIYLFWTGWSGSLTVLSPHISSKSRLMRWQDAG